MQISNTPWMSLYTSTKECSLKTNSKDFDLCETQIISERNFWIAFQVEDSNILNEGISPDCI